MRRHRKPASLLAAAAAVSLALVGCAEDTDEPENGETAPAEGGGQEITIGIFEGWDEGIAASYLMGHVFEDAGYTVNYEYADVVFVYEGVAAGDYDISFDSWLPNTHADYWEQLGDSLENLGVWYEDAVLAIAVNEDSPAQSLADLPDYVDVYGGRVVGIESGSGLNRLTRESVFPTYELEDAGFEFVESSTAAMLEELDAAISAGEDVAVTLWHPHWAYAAYPLRDLEDPEGALAGGNEEINTFGRPGFSEDFPEIAEWVGNFYLSPEQVTEIEDIMVVQDNREDPAGSIQKWLDENPDWIDNLKAGTLR